MTNDKKSLCLVYAHTVNGSGSKWYQSVYKIDLSDVDENTEPATVNKDGRFDQIDPVMVIPSNAQFPMLMSCARIASKLYILGGQMPGHGHKYNDLFPRDVYAFDLLSKPTTKPLDVANKNMEEEVDVFMKRLENIVMDKDVARVTIMPGVMKPYPIVFSANGLLYVFGSITETTMEEEYDEQGLKKLFQCFDPVHKTWTTLKNLPPQNIHTHPIIWVGVNVYQKRQLVVLLGDEMKRYSYPLKVLFFYDLKTNTWTRRDLSMWPNDGRSSLTFLDVDTDKDYLYGLSLSFRACLVKSKTDYLTPQDEIDLASSDGSVPIGDDNRLLKMIIPNESDDVFGLRYFDFQSQFLRYLGKGIFCVITSGLILKPSTIVNGYKYLDTDPYARGVIVTVFKEKKIHNCVHAEILHQQRFAMVTPFINIAKVIGCFVFSTDQLQKNLDERRNKKNKNISKSVQTPGSTSGSSVAGDVAANGF